MLGPVLAVLCPVSKPHAWVWHELPLGTQRAATAASMCVIIHSPVPVSPRPSTAHGLFSSPPFDCTDLYSPAPSGLQAVPVCSWRSVLLQRSSTAVRRRTWQGFSGSFCSISTEHFWGPVSVHDSLCAAKQRCESASLLCPWRWTLLFSKCWEPTEAGPMMVFCLPCRTDLLTQRHKHCPWWHPGWGGWQSVQECCCHVQAEKMERCALDNWWTGGDLFWPIWVSVLLQKVLEMHCHSWRIPLHHHFDAASDVDRWAPHRSH